MNAQRDFQIDDARSIKVTPAASFVTALRLAEHERFRAKRGLLTYCSGRAVQSALLDLFFATNARCRAWRPPECATCSADLQFFLRCRAHTPVVVDCAVIVHNPRFCKRVCQRVPTCASLRSSPLNPLTANGDSSRIGGSSLPVRTLCRSAGARAGAITRDKSALVRQPKVPVRWNGYNIENGRAALQTIGFQNRAHYLRC